VVLPVNKIPSLVKAPRSIVLFETNVVEELEEIRIPPPLSVILPDPPNSAIPVIWNCPAPASWLIFPVPKIPFLKIFTPPF
jgi:hypothetical protein